MSYSQGKFLIERGPPYTEAEVKLMEPYMSSILPDCLLCSGIQGARVNVNNCNGVYAGYFPDALIEDLSNPGTFITPTSADVGRVIDGTNSICYNAWSPGPYSIFQVVPSVNAPYCNYLATDACAGTSTCMKITGTYCDGSGQVVYDNVTLNGFPPTAADVGTIACCYQNQAVSCDPGPIIITQVLPPGVMACFELYTCICPINVDPCAWVGHATSNNATGNCGGNNCDGAATFSVSENPGGTPIPEPCILTYDVTDQSGTSVSSGAVTCTSCWPGTFSHTVYNLCQGTYNMQVTIDNCTGAPIPGQTCTLPQTLNIQAMVIGDPINTCLTDPTCCWLCDENNDCIQDPAGTHNTQLECTQHCTEEIEDDCCVDLCKGTTTGVPPCDNY